MNYKELNNYINQLFYKFFNKYSKLTKEDKEDIKQKIMLNLFIKEKEGVLSGNVENNKNYIFLFLKYEVI